MTSDPPPPSGSRPPLTLCFAVFLRQLQSVILITILQALTTKATDAPLSTCESETLNWTGGFLWGGGLVGLGA